MILAQYQCAVCTITAERVGKPHDDQLLYHVFELHIDGGKHNGAILRASCEESLMAAFDATVEFHKAGLPPYWLGGAA